MPDDVKRQFILASLHFKKVDLCELSHGTIPFGEMVLMRSVQQSCPLTASNLNAAEIADQLCVSRPAVSQMLRSLEEKGYIERQIDTADRRRVTVRSTEEGTKALEKSQQCYDEAVDRLCDSISPEELLTLTRLMTRLTGIYQELKNQKNEK